MVLSIDFPELSLPQSLLNFVTLFLLYMPVCFAEINTVLPPYLWTTVRDLTSPELFRSQTPELFYAKKHEPLKNIP